MDDVIRTRKLTREQIADFIGANPRAIKLIEALVQDVSETLPNSISELQITAAAAAASLENVAQTATDAKDAAQAASLAAMSAQIEQMREQLAAIGDGDIVGLYTAIARLREEAVVSGGMSIYRTIQGSISMGSSVNKSYTISPPLATTQNAILIPLGVAPDSGASNSDASVVLSFTTTTVAATRTTGSAGLLVNFLIVEYA